MRIKAFAAGFGAGEIRATGRPVLYARKPYYPLVARSNEAVAVKLWQALFAMIWIAFLEFLLAMSSHVFVGPFAYTVLIGLHVVLGFGIIALALNNFNGVRNTTIAGRVKRTAKSTFQLSILMAVLGVILVFPDYLTWTIPLIGISLFYAILFVHVVNAFAIITQAAAVAIAYDMWEDKEFNQETKVGEVPPMPAPTKPNAKP